MSHFVGILPTGPMSFDWMLEHQRPKFWQKKTDIRCFNFCGSVQSILVRLGSFCSYLIDRWNVIWLNLEAPNTESLTVGDRWYISLVIFNFGESWNWFLLSLESFIRNFANRSNVIWLNVRAPKTPNFDRRTLTSDVSIFGNREIDS